MDTVRQLLLNIEAGSPVDWDEGMAPDGVSQRDALLHLEMMHDGGLFKGIEVPDSQTGVSLWLNMRLSWAGADFLDSIRDEKIWQATREGVKQAGGFSLELIKALAKGLVKKKIEHHTSVKLDL